ncbi:MAG: helix-turn-helix domain-containing protein [Desulfobacterales bacterium]|nr:helix-turn-helix domain-containing protein [Desulfobacterales bacterium]
MDIASLLRDFAFSKYESACYLALVAQHPSNGSQLSKRSGIARSRIYDVLRGLLKKGIVFEIEKGCYVPLPFEELKKRFRSQFESNLELLEKQLAAVTQEVEYEYLLTLRGREAALKKAAEIIATAGRELYLRLFPPTWHYLEDPIRAAAGRGVAVRLIAMGGIPPVFDIQVSHPEVAGLYAKLGGETIDIIVDREEALVGMFAAERPDQSPVIWTRNRWFVTANRDSLRHDFYHYFLDKLHEQRQPLDAHDLAIYNLIKNDD